ncbi:MAG: PKD repeat protein [Cyclobacteriaceae bacterium]|jgi:PKD repeat protein
MKKVKFYIKQMMVFAIVGATAFSIACDALTDTGDDPVVTEDPIASFQFQVDAADFLKVTFSNFSQNATSYAWDFGDGETSTEESPVHAYAEADTYTVTLTATNDAGNASKSETVALNDPLATQRTLVGDNGKVWQFIADASTGVNAYDVFPEARDQIWWSLGGVEPLCVRECIMDDTWTFNTDGTFTFENNGDAWAEGAFKADLLGGCFDASDASNWVGANGEDLNGWNSGTHDFTFNPASGSLVIVGGFIGLPKAADNAEVSVPQATVSYTVVKLVNAEVDTLVVETPIPGGFWRTTLVSYDNASDKIVVGECAAVEEVNVTFKVDMNDYSGAFTTVYVSGSFNGWSGDANPLSDADVDGVWEVTLPLPASTDNIEYKFQMDGWAAFEQWDNADLECIISSDATNYNRGLSTGTGDMTVSYCFNTCSACAVTVTAADLAGTTWNVPAEPNALVVGPGIGNGDWYKIDQGWVDAAICLFDDTFTFGADGSFVHDPKAEVFLEGGVNGVDANGCYAVGSLPANLTTWGGGTFTYTFADGVDGGNPTVTLSGNGAYIGFYKGASGAELTEPRDGSNTYEIISYSGDVMVVSIDISAGLDRSAAWTYKLVKN